MNAALRLQIRIADGGTFGRNGKGATRKEIDLVEWKNFMRSLTTGIENYWSLARVIYIIRYE